MPKNRAHTQISEAAKGEAPDPCKFWWWPFFNQGAWSNVTIKYLYRAHQVLDYWEIELDVLSTHIFCSPFHTVYKKEMRGDISLFQMWTSTDSSLSFELLVPEAIVSGEHRSSIIVLGWQGWWQDVAERLCEVWLGALNALTCGPFSSAFSTINWILNIHHTGPELCG